MQNYTPSGPAPGMPPPITPPPTHQLQTAAGGNRATGNPPLDAKWNRREPSPFYYHKQADHMPDVPCEVCEAPLHRYEVERHLASCERIAASDGKDAPIFVNEDEV